LFECISIVFRCHAWFTISHNFWITVFINIDSVFVTYNLTGNLKVQVIGHGEQVDGINKLEGLDSGAVVEIIQRFIPQAAELTTVFLIYIA
jgi:hypothetical protein